jgi:ATP-dependent helicase/nuclease subunit B
LLKALLADVAVRPPQGGHPRLSILGPLEAQLQRADLMVLGGLNEGIWPGKAAPDPWLAPAIRARLGLPGRPRETGLAAHDFVRGLGAREVLLTRSRRDASAPLVPSRFWLRLEAFAGGLPAEERLVAIARRFEGGGQPEPVPAPRPAPPAALRPQRLNLTEVDTLVVDPFAFYARRMLRLAPLDPLDEDPNAATRGTRIHGVLEHWVKDGSGTLAQLEQKAREMLHAEGKSFPLLRALWSPRALRAILWAGEQVLAREALGWEVLAAEAGGELVLANGIVVAGRADRVDRDADGNLAIIDYKTGRAPSAAQVQAGLASQLGLLAAMAAAGARAVDKSPVPPGPPGELAYWRLTGGSKPGDISNPLKAKSAPSPVEHVEAVLAHVTQVTTALLQSDAPMRPQVHPGFSWGDFDHLARVAEWLDRPERRR